MSQQPGGGVPGIGNGPEELLDDTVAVIAGVVIETRPGCAPTVACRLEEIDGLEIAGGDGDRRLAGVWSAPSARALEKMVKEVVRNDKDLLGVFPTFIGRADGEGVDSTKLARQGALGAMTGDEGSDSGP
jgi:hypothetical protein